MKTETMSTTTTHQFQRHASKSMNTLIRLREQHKMNLTNDDDHDDDGNMDNQNQIPSSAGTDCDLRPSSSAMIENSNDEVNESGIQKKNGKEITTKKKTASPSSMLPLSPSFPATNNVHRVSDIQVSTIPFSPSFENENEDNETINEEFELDMYAPLMPEEADEDQLAEFVTGLDDLFLQQAVVVEEDDDEDATATKMMDRNVYPASKRRRVSLEERRDSVPSSTSSSSSSPISYYSIDTDDDYESFDDYDITAVRRKLRTYSGDLCFEN